MHPELLAIYNAAQKATSVTRQLLALGRKQVRQPRILNPNNGIWNVDPMLRSLISDNIEPRCELADNLRSVEADRGQIEQVLMNLVVNALDAMSAGGGSLSIQSANAELPHTPSENRARIDDGHFAKLAVRDTGSGMDDDTLSHIFEPFRTTKDKVGGTGLGLSTAYGIIQQSKGFISVAREPGEGTTLKIYLPEPMVTADPLDAHARVTPRGCETILVAQDAGLGQLTHELLKVHGYNVIEAAEGEQALLISKTYAGKIDLTLSDVVMPGMTGRELAEQGVQLRPDMKVLWISGYTDEISKAGFLRPGLHFIEKPFTSNPLALKIRDVLDHPDY